MFPNIIVYTKIYGRLEHHLKITVVFANQNYRVKMSYVTSVDGIDLIGQLSRDVIGRLPVKP